MQKPIIFAIATLWLISCRSSPTSQPNDQPDKIEFDPGSILPWSKASKNLETAKSPALYEFRRGKKTLLYLASQHSNKITDPAFKLIKEASNRRPEIFILEGFAYDLGMSPQSISSAVLDGIKDGFYPSGEPAYAIQLAGETKTPFVGGEPAEPYLLDRAKSNGYRANDLLSFDFVRRVPQMNRSGELKSKSLEASYNEYIKTEAKSYGYSGPTLSFSEFKKWYQDKQGKEFTLSSGDKGETAPVDDGPFYTQKISVVVTRARDEHILQTIAEVMNKYDRVLVVYGSSHYRIEHEAIKKALGEPKVVSAD